MPIKDRRRGIGFVVFERGRGGCVFSWDGFVFQEVLLCLDVAGRTSTSTVTEHCVLSRFAKMSLATRHPMRFDQFFTCENRARSGDFRGYEGKNKNDPAMYVNDTTSARKKKGSHRKT